MENKTESTIALRKTFGQVTDALNITGGQLKETKKLDDEASVEDILSKSPAEVDPAPLPGSLADREHRKWMEAAVSLRNNPYSKENIDKRRYRRSSSFLGKNEIQEWVWTGIDTYYYVHVAFSRKNFAESESVTRVR